MTLDLFPAPTREQFLEAEPDERYTPGSVFEPLNREFAFTLDVCATAESAKCKRYFTKRQNGLEQSWEGERVWCNPPYSDIEPWVRKAWASKAERVAMLVPAWTDREWWAELVEPLRDGRRRSWPFDLRTRFIRGRIRFGHKGNPEGVGAGSPPFWCVLLVWERA